jgi:hypothetical protein
MKSRLGGLCFAWLLAGGSAFAAAPTFCTPVPLDETGARDYEYPALVLAYKGISRAAKFEPILLVCPAPPNASARFDEDGNTVVQVTTGLLGLLGNDASEIAAVLGHEFGHLMLRHAERRVGYGKNTIAQVSREAQRSINRGADPKAAIRAATTKFLGNVTAFSRDAEREADAQGHALVMSAGFDPTATARVLTKLRALQGGDQRGWLASHPGLDERVQSSTSYMQNEEYRARAAESLRARRLGELKQITTEWRAKLPDSGAAAYYEGVSMLLQGGPASARASAAFEDAVVLFTQESISRAAQSYQTEGSAATIALCVSHYREGRRTQTMNCLRRLETNEEVDVFRQVTGWNDFVLVGFEPVASPAPLYGGQSASGTVTITNCKALAQKQDMKQLRSFTAARPSASATKPEPEAMRCNPRDPCDCEPVDLEEILSKRR